MELDDESFPTFLFDDYKISPTDHKGKGPRHRHRSYPLRMKVYMPDE